MPHTSLLKTFFLITSLTLPLTLSARSSSRTTPLISATNNNKAKLKPTGPSSFFLNGLHLSQTTTNLALATHKVGFIRITSKKIIVCRYDYFAGQIDLTKYEKYDKDFRAVKTEAFYHAVEQTTCCTRKTKDARKTVPLAEFLARMLHATTNPNDVKYTSFADLYKESIPTWIQADNAEDIQHLLLNLHEDLADQQINLINQDQLLKPAIVFSVKNDPFLHSLPPSLWTTIQEIMHPTTFLNKELRELFWKAKDFLIEAKSIAKKNGIDLNPSLIEGIFSDLEKSSRSFSTKKMIRQIFINTRKNIINWCIPALVTTGIAWSVIKLYRKINDSNRKNMVKQAEKAVVIANIRKALDKKMSGSDIRKTPAIWKATAWTAPT